MNSCTKEALHKNIQSLIGNGTNCPRWYTSHYKLTLYVAQLAGHQWLAGWSYTTPKM